MKTAEESKKTLKLITTEELKELLEKNAELDEKLRVLDGNKEEISKILSEYGYELKPEEGEITDDEAKAAAGGARRVETKYPCPKCGSWYVANFDPGFFYQMRVICPNCGFRGTRSGESEKLDDVCYWDFGDH